MCVAREVRAWREKVCGRFMLGPGRAQLTGDIYSQRAPPTGAPVLSNTRVHCYPMHLLVVEVYLTHLLVPFRSRLRRARVRMQRG